MPTSVEFRPIILAGGSGTRFWPRSRKARAKQVLALDGERTMIQRTVERLGPLSPASDVWVITNELLSNTISDQLSGVPIDQVICEPVARNTPRRPRGWPLSWSRRPAPMPCSGCSRRTRSSAMSPRFSLSLNMR